MKKVIKFIPLWKLLLYVVFAAILTGITAFILTSAVLFLETQSSRLSELIELVASFGLTPIVLVLFIVLVLYLLPFFYYERQRYVDYLLIQMMNEIEYISEGHFNQKVTIEDKSIIGELGVKVNQIITEVEKAIVDQKESAQIKNDLITNVAHDLRSPLTSIVGYLDLINDDRYKSEVELRYYLQIIHQKSKDLHQLMDDLFDYTLVQNKESLTNEAPINMEEMLNQLAVQFQFQVKAAGMEMRQSLSTVNSPVVMGDGNKLARIFENLIQNAIRYGKDGRYIDIVLSESIKFIEIHIINYGQVIPSIDLPYIFERFYRVEKSRSQHTGGSGLGLAIVKSIVELHGGQIEVESSLGRTAFIVKFPKIEQ
ncbi:signal transduction histidine kinase [Cytobacillus eiseniae]|uniref:histidine kinase n=1 Tax=Cytobacillus eiseniae TaxID=762947 RepID=A0ABS4RGV9_9BACI|nr:ATP-binding protein [Cytobacillus eiseniae]MBP2242127.1 signal transduction histidine kinase [Cytobacillus eiseniae]